MRLFIVTRTVLARQRCSGFTLVETLVAISLLFVLFAGPFAILQQSIRTGAFVKDQTVAYYLAQDAEEYIKNMRDNSLIAGTPHFGEFIAACGTTCYLETTKARPASTADVVHVCTGTCPPLRYDEASDLYGYDPGDPVSPYIRTITVTPDPDDPLNTHEFLVSVSVSWSAGFVPRAVTVNYGIFDFMQAVSSFDTDDDTDPEDAPSVGLVGYWPFDTDASDQAGGHDGTLRNGAFITIGSKVGAGALSLNGINQYVDMGDVLDWNNAQSFTLSAWVRPLTLFSSTRRIISKRSSAAAPQTGYELSLSTSQTSLNTVDDGDTTRAAGGSGNIPIGQWTHVVMVVDRAPPTMTAYTNGEVGSPISISSINDLNNTLPLRIGASSNGAGTNFFGGQVDDVRIYDRALTASEVDELFHSSGDSVAPGRIEDLADTATTFSSVTLDWSAPGDEGCCDGVASSYDLRFSRFPIDPNSWVSATQAGGLPVPGPPGAVQSVTVSGLLSETDYYFAMRAYDEAGNQSPLSNIVAVTTDAGSDGGPPTPPTALSASAVSATHAHLSWSASTDDISVAGYKIERCSGISCGAYIEIDAVNGATLTFDDTGLDEHTYYRYRVRAYDAAANNSQYSISALALTPYALVGNWTFDEGAGPLAYDLAGALGDHGFLTNGPAWTTQAKVGSHALSFDGADDYVAANGPEITNLHEYTVSLWIFMNSAGEANAGRMVTKGNFLRLYQSNGNRVVFESTRWSGNNGVWQTPSGSLSTGGWRHIAVTYDDSSPSNNPVMYIDGVLQSIAETSTPSGSLAPDSGVLYIGNEPDATRTFNGRIDDVRLYSSILTPSEIQSVYGL